MSGQEPAARVAVVTVSFNSERDLAVFLASVDAEYLALPENPGYGGAVNAAAARLPDSVEWLLVANPDIRLGARSLDRLVEVAAADPGIGAVGPAVLNPDGSIYPSARAVPSIRTGIGHALFANLWQGNPWTRRYRAETADGSLPRDAGWLSGSCLLIRRSAFDEVGGFDEGYFMYFEDVDLGWRLGRAGWRNRYDPAAVVTHLGGTSTAAAAERMVVAHHDSAKRFIDRKYAASWLWPLRATLHLGLALRSRIAQRRARRTGASG